MALPQPPALLASVPGQALSQPPSYADVLLQNEIEDTSRLPTYQQRPLRRYHPYVRLAPPPQDQDRSSLDRYINTIYDEGYVPLIVPAAPAIPRIPVPFPMLPANPILVPAPAPVPAVAPPPVSAPASDPLSELHALDQRIRRLGEAIRVEDALLEWFAVQRGTRGRDGTALPGAGGPSSSSAPPPPPPAPLD